MLLEIQLTALIQGSFSFLIILTEQGTTSERHACVLPAQGCVKNYVSLRHIIFNEITYFAEIFSSKMLWRVEKLAEWLGLPILSPSFQCASSYLYFFVHLKAEHFPGLPSAAAAAGCVRSAPISK